jgi:adenylate cyclase
MSKRIPLFLGLCLTALALWVLMTPNRFVRNMMERFDNLGYDLQLITYIVTKQPQPSPSVAIIDIDDKSLAAEGQWPWPRNKMAELVDALNAQGAAVIAFDMLFAEKQNNVIDQLFETLDQHQKLTDTLKSELSANTELFNDDALFAASLEKAHVVLALSFSPRNVAENSLPPPMFTLPASGEHALNITTAPGYISNYEPLQTAAKQAGFINIFPDKDGIIRHVPMLIEYHDGIYPSLALQAVMTFLDVQPELVTPLYADKRVLEGIRIGGTIVPTDATGQTLIPFIGKSYTFTYYSATDVLHNKLPKDALLGKILFVGTSATGLGDLKATAIQNPFPGVEVQAAIASGILTDEFSYRPAWTYGANVTLALLLGLFATFTFPYFGPKTLGGIVLVLPTGLLFFNNWLWVHTGYILSFLVPVVLVLVIAVMNVLYGYLFESRRREHLKSMFGQYVPSKHIDEMLKTSSKSFGLRGDDREMSVLFADIRNFTTLSEGMSATKLVDVLNTFFTPMTEIIFNNHGTIDKYVGDLIMAFWGAPLPDSEHAKNALASALAMQKKVSEMQSTLKEHGWEDTHIGIGINSGLMSVGDMGSQYRRNYTVLGDAVNLASRVESLTKYYGVNILVTEATQANQPEFAFRLCDKVRVKGKKMAVSIYEVVGYTNALSEADKLDLQQYDEALNAYFKQEWERSRKLFTALQQKTPSRTLYSLYLERIQTYESKPPTLQWDGVYVHTQK